MNNLLKNRKIVVIVTGSIAAYKSLELIRLFVKSGANVRVVMSESAKRFIAPLSFEAISQNEVLHEGSESWANENNHIGAAKWADVCIIAPASINTIAKLAHGIADNLPTQVLIAFNRAKILAPSANTAMYKNEVTTQNLAKLSSYGYIIASTQTKLLACGDMGDGAMASENEIFWLSAQELLKDKFWSGRDVLITGGGTNEPIDDVRFITNASSGKMAEALAKSAFIKGANVTLICTYQPQNLPNDVKIVIAKTAMQMKDILQNEIKKAPKYLTPYLFMASAVADFAPKKQNGKVKKNQIGEEWNLTLYKTVDILSSIEKSEIKTIGFKAETDEQTALNMAQNMLIEKNLDAVVLNVIGVDAQFGSDDTRLRLVTKNGQNVFKLQGKLFAALELLDSLITL